MDQWLRYEEAPIDLLRLNDLAIIRLREKRRGNVGGGASRPKN